MYKVYCDKHLLYDTRIEELKLLNPKVDIELNKTSAFSFTIYPSHPYFNMLQKLKSIITIYQNSDVIFRGRILDDTEGLKKERQVICEGELAFLFDSVQRPYVFKGDVAELFAQFIEAHNAQAEEDKRFKVGKVTVTDSNGYISRSDTQYLSTYDSIFKKLIDTHGGYLSFRHEEDGVYIDYLEDFTLLNSQDIELRKNVLDLSAETSGTDIATAILPLGAKIKEEQPEETPDTPESTAEGEESTQQEEKRLTIESVNGGVDYVYDAEAVKRFGFILKVMTWDDVTLPKNLLRKANEELSNAFLFDKSLEITAVDLSGTDKDIASFRVGTYNKVKIDTHGIDEFMLVTKQSINLANPKGDKLVLGRKSKSLTEQEKDNSDKLGNIVERVETIIGDYELNKPLIEEALKNKVVQSDTEPSNKSWIWCDTSMNPPIFKRWDGEAWVIINDITEEIVSLREELTSKISQTSDGIRQEVFENYYVKGETDTLISSVSTQLEQTKNDITFTFNEFNKELDDLSDKTNAEFKNIEKYIRFADGNIEMGAVGNEFKQLLTKDKNSFMQNGVEIAYFGNRKMYVTDGEFVNSLQVGNFAFIPRENGNTSFKKVR